MFMVSNRNAYHHPLEPHNAVICFRLSSHICTYVRFGTMQSSFSQRNEHENTAKQLCNAVISVGCFVAILAKCSCLNKMKAYWCASSHTDAPQTTRQMIKQNPSIEFCSCLKMLMASAYYASNSSQSSHCSKQVSLMILAILDNTYLQICLARMAKICSKASA